MKINELIDMVESLAEDNPSGKDGEIQFATGPSDTGLVAVSHYYDPDRKISWIDLEPPSDEDTS